MRRHQGKAIVDHLLPPEVYQVIQRFEFFDYDPNSPILTRLKSSLSSEYNYRLIDRELLEQCEWKSDMEFYCGKNLVSATNIPTKFLNIILKIQHIQPVKVLDFKVIL
jgi:hypothetical protein